MLSALAVTPAPESAVVVGANPVTTVLLLGLLTLLPFVLMMTTSFLKFSVVLSILRSALGTQQIPPTPVIMGLSAVLTLYVMAPVGKQMYDRLAGELAAESATPTLSGDGARTILAALGDSKEPLRAFLKRHANQNELAMFLGYANIAQENVTAATRPPATPPSSFTPPPVGAAPSAGSLPAAAPPLAVREDDLLVLMPAFAISELAEAFKIGFMLFLPFLIIDMVISNILLAMGMHMLSPVVVSLPFKLLLFVVVDGWTLLAQGLMQPYLA